MAIIISVGIRCQENRCNGDCVVVFFNTISSCINWILKKNQNKFYHTLTLTHTEFSRQEIYQYTITKRKNALQFTSRNWYNLFACTRHSVSRWMVVTRIQSLREGTILELHEMTDQSRATSGDVTISISRVSMIQGVRKKENMLCNSHRRILSIISSETRSF